MKYLKLLYIILAIILLLFLIYQNNKIYLEGYTYLPDLNKINPNPLKIINGTLSQCKRECNISNKGCSGFVSEISFGGTNSGNCTLYNANDLDLSLNDLNNLRYQNGSYLYIK